MLTEKVLFDDVIFLDIEATHEKHIKELGVISRDKELKSSSISKIVSFIKEAQTPFICGHNFINFDYEILKPTSLYQPLQQLDIIDTLPLSLLLFKEKTLHNLPKNYKNEDDFKNDPVEDSKLTRMLLEKLVTRFLSLDAEMQNIFYSLLKEQKHFNGFFRYMQQEHHFTLLYHDSLYASIMTLYKDLIVTTNLLPTLIKSNPIELAYILSLISPHTEIKSHPPKVLYDYPEIISIQKKLCFDIKKSSDTLSEFATDVFGFGEFREFPKLNPTLFGKSNISQKDIMKASLNDDSFLVVLPTGGGKTFTFWLPALVKAKAYKSLTVVISPLQALIEDHIKSFNKNVANYKAVAISGFMSPLERAEAIEQTINGEADILYIAPESLRSNMIFNILKNRLIERFVVDEVHCLSTWGNDFRQDYYYICDYIKELVEAKPFQEHIPISCFTATAKPSVIQDIKEYFHDGLDIKLDDYIATPERKNLTYKSIPSQSKDKYTALLKLIMEYDGSTLIYIPSSTKNCDEIAQKLSMDTDKRVKSFHSKIESQEKMNILKDYILDEIDIIVATTAFGMGVDKPNITNVIHYEMSDSLESYAQEAGRGARDTSLHAFCPILFDENDLDKHFSTLNRSKITTSDINSIFRVLKKSKGDVVYKSAFELAQSSGWDVEDDAFDYATKIKTALLELEREGYIHRKRNQVRFYADSIASNSIEKLEKALQNTQLSKEDQERLTLVHQTIIGRGKTQAVQVDELAYLLGYPKHTISDAILQLKNMQILGDSKDLTLECKKNALKKFEIIQQIELTLFKYLSTILLDSVTIKTLNEEISKDKNNADLIKEIVRNWRDKSNFIFKRIDRQNDLWYFNFLDKENAKIALEKKHEIAIMILTFFTEKLKNNQKAQTILFSLKELQEQTNKKYTLKELDKTLLYLHHLHIVELLNGRFISYSPMQIEKKEKFASKRKYTHSEYKKRLEKHYLTKIESIHIMGEYASKLKNDNTAAIRFMRDYFTSPYEDFKKKYKLAKKRITRPITEHKYNKIFSKMSPVQQEIISDKQTKAMMILAGPGAGKTKVLVHKIASLILTEDIHPEQFMMLTFSRTAMRDFKSRLNELIGAVSFDIEINTFHAFSLKLIARVVTSENENILNTSIKEATKQINSGEAILPLKTVLILDEFQDINHDSFELVKAIYEASDSEIRIIAVGDDDQCINTHAGANVNFINKFESTFGKDDEGNNIFKQYELLTNFRSKSDIVAYSNSFASKISNRYKTQPLSSYSKERGIVTVKTFKSDDLISPVIEMIKEEKELKDIAILAHTNDEVLQLYSSLQELGIPARFIIERSRFKLRDIVEIVAFDKALQYYLNTNTFYQEKDFIKALQSVESTYRGSKNLDILRRLIDKFLYESQDYYVSQWLAYLDDISLEEFENKGKSITVSTIHKSKGMEFDKVFLIVKNNPKDDASKRLYYVGMTRAKNSLAIIRQGNKNLKEQPFAHYTYDDKPYIQQNRRRTFVMGLNDIYLNYDYQKFYKGYLLIAGSKVELKQDKFGNLSIYQNNKKIGQFSKDFINNLNYTGGKYEANIDHVVVWYDKVNQRHNTHPLCKITLFL